MSELEVRSTFIETVHGEFQLLCYSWGPHEEDNVLCLRKGSEKQDVLVRVQSACYTGEIFESLDCDCHDQLVKSLSMIQSQGGLLVYMLCDGRGAGLLKKIEGLELGRSHGLDTSDAYASMGIDQDPRDYSRVIDILDLLSIRSVRLLTNNPRKIEGVAQRGLQVTHEPLEIDATEYSRDYLKTKAQKMGHLMKQFGTAHD